MKKPTQIIKKARDLRSNMTDAEQKLWQYLRMRQMHGLKFRRQHPLDRYILDFACVEHKIAIELDGGQHADMVEKDTMRTAFLTSQGWTVLRFWNHQVFEQTGAVLDSIAASCKSTID